jgi:hypothetical protein
LSEASGTRKDGLNTITENKPFMMIAALMTVAVGNAIATEAWGFTGPLEWGPLLRILVLWPVSIILAMFAIKSSTNHGEGLGVDVFIRLWIARIGIVNLIFSMVVLVVRMVV